MRASLWLPTLIACCALAPAQAAFRDYTIAIPDGREATFEAPFAVEHAGTVTIEASWIGPRLLFFGVEGPGRAPSARRSGPSPQRIELTAVAATIASGTKWKLTVKALPARGEASGRVRVTVPDAPEIVARREAELHPPPPPPPPPPAWTVARTPPPTAPPEVARFYEAVETLRAGVIRASDGPDECSWQIEFLEYATAWRDRLGDRGETPDVPTLRYLSRVAEAIRRVDTMRTSTDPTMAGPVPADRDARRDWLMARGELVRPIERSLDELTELLRGGHAPALEVEPWLPRLTACLTACERYFNERVRIGSDENAAHHDLEAAQWGHILAAERVLAAFGDILLFPSKTERTE